MIDVTELSPMQLNVLQVSIDHMVEHLHELVIESSVGDIDELQVHIINCERLIAAKQLKEALS